MKMEIVLNVIPIWKLVMMASCVFLPDVISVILSR